MPTSRPRISTRWRVAIFVFFAAALNYADRAALFSVIPPVREDLGATDAQIGLMGSLFLWSYALASPLAGAVADRYSRTRIVLWSIVAWSGITFCTGLATNVTTVYILRILLGLAESLYLPAAAALLGDYHPPETRGRAMGLHLLGLNLGVLVGAAVAGTMAEWYGWRLGFWVLGGLGIALALAYRLWVVPGPAAQAEARMSAPSATIREAYGYILRVPSFHVLLFSAMIAGVASWLFLTWLPLYFRENLGLAIATAGVVGLALFKLPGALGIALGGWLSDWAAQRETRGRAMIKALSFLVSAPFLIFFLGEPAFGVVAVILVGYSVIRGLGTPSEHPIICDIVPPPYRSSAIGLMNTAGTAAGGVGVLLAGIFKADLGLGLIFAGSSALFVVAGLAVLWAYHRFMPRDVVRAARWEKGRAASGGLGGKCVEVRGPD